MPWCRWGWWWELGGFTQLIPTHLPHPLVPRLVLSLSVQGGLLGPPSPSATCFGGEGKINNASKRSTFHSWAGFRISCFFSWVYEEVRGLSRACCANGLGEFIWTLVRVWDIETWPWIIRLKEKAISPPQMDTIARENLLYPSLAGHGLQRLVFPD